jgi:hypothetical protein
LFFIKKYAVTYKFADFKILIHVFPTFCNTSVTFMQISLNLNGKINLNTFKKNPSLFQTERINKHKNVRKVHKILTLHNINKTYVKTLITKP